MFLGRLDPVKDVPTLVAAVARLPGVRLHVYGDGPDRPASRPPRASLADRVTLHGTVARPQDALARPACSCSRRWPRGSAWC